MQEISNWKIVPSTDDTVSLIGDVNGILTQTSSIKFARPGEVRTQNTHYKLGEKSPGMWEIQLEMRRPSQVANLRRLGVL